jgi:tetratricopeptide (TPR) repeat protein
MGERRDVERAAELLDEGLELQKVGAYGEAIEYYRRSIDACPTPEAYTYLGWALGMQGALDEAIRQCECAIALDPSYGNPYNDIGVYLIRKGDPEQALPWFERAKRAACYEARHFPYLNAGHVFAARGMLIRALAEFETALALEPTDYTARHAVRTISTHLH